MVLYYGSQAIIGLSAKGGYYNSFVAEYLNYPLALRKALLHTSGAILDLLGYQSEIVEPFKVKLVNGRGVKIVYSCLGIGLFSFWAAFIFANKSSLRRSILFLFAGLLFIFLINVLRLVLLCIAVNKNWNMLFGLDHHTLFSIASYTLIILLILAFDISEKNSVLFKSSKETR